MTWRFPTRFDAKHPDIENFQSFIQQALEQHQLTETFGVDHIVAIAYSRTEEKSVPTSIAEIQWAWLKTTCLEIIKELSQQRINRQQFDTAVKALFDGGNPDARSFCANVARTLRQFRLSGAYDVREIIAEAYARGVKRIEAGQTIEIPLAWLRTTCLNVIREFRQKQNKADKPRIDSDGFDQGDRVFTDLMQAEDRKAIRLALMQLNRDEIKLLCSRVLDQQSWQEIGESLSDAEGITLNANATRQRGYRVLQKLRHHYDSIRQEVQITQEDVEFQAALISQRDWTKDLLS